MRVTSQMVSQRFIKNMHKSNEAIANLQGQISSGRQFEKISDNPTVTLQGLSHRSSLMQIEQFQKNVQDGMDWLTATDDALGNATDVLQRVRELMIEASNDTNSESEKKNSFAKEIRNLKEQLGNIANTTFKDRFLFSGLDSTTPPYQNGTLTSTGDSSMVWNFSSGQNVKINVTADSVFGMEVNGKNLPSTIDSIIQRLENGESPNPFLSTIDKQLDNVLTQRTIVGANHNMLELEANKLDQAGYLNQKLLSKKVDTDIAKVYMELTTHETALKASLTAGAKIMQTTLADFLR